MRLNKILEWMRNEPVRVYYTVLGMLSVAASFGVDITADQRTAIITLLAVVLGIGGEQVRKRVRPESDVQRNFRPRDLRG